MKKIQMAIIGALIIGMVQPATANQCDYAGLKQNVAWSIGTDSKFAVLSRHQTFKQNQGITDEAEIKAKVLDYIKSVRAPISSVSDSKLASLITKAHLVTGTSFAAIAGITHQESLFCKFRLNQTGGDSGCMQFTSIAVKELKDQFGVGEMKGSPRVEELLVSWADEYFGVGTARRQAFRNWMLTEDPKQMMVALRSPGNEDIDIFAGATLIKIYLAVNDGDYIKAIRDYNGGGDPGYADKKILPKAYKVSYQCEDYNAESAAYVESLFDNICYADSKGNEDSYNECMMNMSSESKQTLVSNTEWI